VRVLAEARPCFATFPFKDDTPARFPEGADETLPPVDLPHF
jgi:hypothetical protein